MAFQAAAVLDSVRSIERLTQVLGKKLQTLPPNPVDDDNVQRYLLELKRAFSTDADIEKQLKIIRKISTRAVKVLDQGTLSKLKHASQELGISSSEFNEVKSLWHLRNNKLAHPGELPDDLEKEANAAIKLGRSFLNAYLEKRLSNH